MRRYLFMASLMVCSLVLILTGCGGGGEQEQQAEPEPAAEKPPTAEEVTKPPALVIIDTTCTPDPWEVKSHPGHRINWKNESGDTANVDIPEALGEDLAIPHNKVDGINIAAGADTGYYEYTIDCVHIDEDTDRGSPGIIVGDPKRANEN